MILNLLYLIVSELEIFLHYCFIENHHHLLQNFRNIFKIYPFSVVTMSKGVKQKCTFNREWQADYPFLKKVHGRNDRVKCTHCLSEFSISLGGRSDIKDHTKSVKHKANLQVAAKNLRLDNFLKKTLLDDGDMLIAAKEATFANHSAVHNISFKTAGCSSKLIAKLFELKFSSAGTKTESIIWHAIVPLAAEELKNDLMEINFVTLTADTSNRKNIKLIPIMVRYFWPEEGVKSKLLISILFLEKQLLL